MTKTKKRWNSILWIEGFGFCLIILLSWLTEIIRIPHLLFGESFVPNWNRAVLRTVVISLIWLWVNLATRRLLKRLHYLEEFMRICGWCRKVCYEGEWVAMEKYISSNFSTQTTHGMCPDCLKKGKEEIWKKSQESTAAENKPDSVTGAK
jgi:hypothetical protein